MHMIRNIGFVFLLILISPACQEVYIPEIDDVEPFMVVEGYISTVAGDNKVELSRSKSYSTGVYNTERVSDARVEIYIQEQGDVIPFTETSRGTYRTTGNYSDFAAETGETYILVVETADGEVYESTPQTVVTSPEIDQLYCEYNEETMLTENENGDAIDVHHEGIDINTGTTGQLATDNYYFYKWTAIEQHREYYTNGPTEVTNYRYRRLSSFYSNIIKTGNADVFANNRLLDETVVFLAKHYFYELYDPPEEYDYYITDFQGMLFRLRQYSLSPGAYEFWRNAEKQLDAEGTLFDPLSPQLNGNFECTSDPSKKVLGIFHASDVAERYAYFYLNPFGKTASMEISGFPEPIFFDSLYTASPEGWIRPPF